MNDVLAFHRSLPGFAPTPLVELPGVGWFKDETARLGLPAFKILGASWALECALGRVSGVERVVAASAGNHGRAVARAAAWRGLACRIYLPARSLSARRTAITEEGAEVVVVDGSYEDAVAAAEADGGLLIADVGDNAPARDVIDGYLTLFGEIDVECDAVVVPVGVGSLCAAAVRWARPRGVKVVAVEPESAACLAAALKAGEPVEIATPGTAMAGMDCAIVSAAAWPDLREVSQVITVSDDELPEGLAALRDVGIEGGECGAAAAVAARRLAAEPVESVRGGSFRRVRCVAVVTEGVTSR